MSPSEVISGWRKPANSYSILNHGQFMLLPLLFSQKLFRKVGFFLSETYRSLFFFQEVTQFLSCLTRKWVYVYLERKH